MTERPASPELEPQEDWSLHDLQVRVEEIYADHDRESDYGPDTMLIKLLGNAEVLKKIARKDPANTEALDRSLTNVFIWTATVANKAQTSLQIVLQEKYGNGCQRCKQIPCRMASGETCEDSDNFLGTRPAKIPESFNEWQEHLAGIYPNNYAEGPQAALKFTSERLLEEVSELISSTHRDVERELSQFSRYRNHEDKTFPWKGEIADVLAWGLAVAESLNRMTDNYSEGCPFCKSQKCSCPKEVTVIDELSRGPN